jgi:hypothetical protein
MHTAFASVSTSNSQLSYTTVFSFCVLVPKSMTYINLYAFPSANRPKQEWHWCIRFATDVIVQWRYPFPF